MNSELRFAGGGRERVLEVVRRRQARSLRLTVDPRDGAVRLSMPQRAALNPALAWAAGKRSWVEGELGKLPVPRPIVPGMTFELAGEDVTLDWAEHYPRRVERLGERLRVGGPRDLLGGRVLRWLRVEALRLLDAETRALALPHGISVSEVGVGDPGSRWGSCSSSGAIRYSWRLILAPPFVRTATVAHELAHRLRMDHSPAFHAAAARILDADPAPARRWLRAHGSALHWFGREG